ncbi:MAG: hypothetical protein IJ158_01920 [Treponema sp.]|nr:hypothetical protein [Treponema sp.]
MKTSVTLSELKRKPVSVERLIQLSKLSERTVDCSDIPEQSAADFKAFKPKYIENTKSAHN